MSRLRYRIGAGLVCAYGALFVTVNFADKLLLWPQTRPEPAYGAERSLLPGPRPLEIWKARSRPDEEPKAIVLRFTGNADRAERWIAREAKGYGGYSVEFWGVNYPGFGGSAGPASLRGVAEAADRAADAAFASAHGRPVFAFGASMGTAAALRVAAHHPVAGVLLQDPPALRELVRREHGLWNLWILALPVSLQIPSSVDSVANAARSTAPASFVTSENDTLVPPYIQRLVVDAYAGPKVSFTIPGGTHGAATTPEISAALDRRFRALYEGRAP